MAAKNAPTPEPIILEDGLTVGTPVVEQKVKPTMVQVLIPEAPEAESGVQIDPYEHVTVGNLNFTKDYQVLRGVPVEVPIPVFEQLRNKYPHL